ncbi:hypothetical protein [Streptomyces formicae]|uniref:hypothetical protein n=1 Tax=Streptomyces formicae TaxID=1616117 RepID=UPI001F5A8BC9|nr:hypothetical protein [Streptomyces formicae]
MAVDPYRFPGADTFGRAGDAGVIHADDFHADDFQADNFPTDGFPADGLRAGDFRGADFGTGDFRAGDLRTDDLSAGDFLLPAPDPDARLSVPLSASDRRRLELHAALTTAGIAPLPGDLAAIDALCVLDDTTNATVQRWISGSP